MTDHIKIDADNILHDAVNLRKAVEIDAKSHINKIWHDIDNTAKWPVHKLQALITDLKKHLP
jgi:hypothetical protein